MIYSLNHRLTVVIALSLYNARTEITNTILDELGFLKWVCGNIPLTQYSLIISSQNLIVEEIQDGGMGSLHVVIDGLHNKVFSKEQIMSYKTV